MNCKPNPTPEAMVFLTAQEAADYLRIPLGSLYVRICKKEIPCTRLGRLLRFRRGELDALMVPNAPPAAVDEIPETQCEPTAPASAGALVAPESPAEEPETEKAS